MVRSSRTKTWMADETPPAVRFKHLRCQAVGRRRTPAIPPNQNHWAERTKLFAYARFLISSKVGMFAHLIVTNPRAHRPVRWPNPRSGEPRDTPPAILCQDQHKRLRVSRAQAARRAMLAAIRIVAACVFCAAAAAAAEAPPGAPIPELSPQQQEVSRIARERGDKQFLMVDKTRGEILLFEDGQPVFGGAALTGAGMGDRIPAKVLTFSGNHPLTVDQKITPAGRFTVRPEPDPDYGRVWTINEVHGKDWDIAIYQVYLGTRPSTGTRASARRTPSTITSPMAASMSNGRRSSF